MMWEERHCERFQGGSQGCDLTARAHDSLWISQRHFQSSSSPSASYLSAVVPRSCPACSLPPGWVGSCLPMQQVGKCTSANAADNSDCKEALSFLQSQLLQPAHCPCSWAQELVQGQDRSEWWERAGHQAAIELHLLFMVSHLAEMSRKREEILLLILSPPPATDSCPIPLGMALAIR